MIRIALLLLFILVLFRYVEGFNPYLPELRSEDYPDQSDFIDLIIAEKYIFKAINQEPNKSSPKISHLTDLLNLLQFI
jgi:hypothetical protein